MTARSPSRRTTRALISWASFVMLCFVLLLAPLAGGAEGAVMTFSADRDNNLLKSTWAGGGSGRQINDVNLGGGPRLAVGKSGGDDNRSIISFDVSPLAGRYRSIDAITMRLAFTRFGLTQAFSTSFDVRVHQISAANADWVEGTGTNDGGSGDDTGSTWREKDRGVADWAGGTGTTATGGLISAGADYDTTLLASINSGTTLPLDNSPIDLDFTGTSAELTSLVGDLLTTNTGFLLFTTTPMGDLVNNRDRMRFHSREVASANLRPQLIVEYTVPEPSSWISWMLGLGLTGLWWLPLRRRHGR